MFSIVFLCVSLCAGISAQSGRVKKKKTKENEKPKPVVYNPTQKVTSKPTPTPKANPNERPRTVNEVRDPDEITFESNFVPIPVSVIDNATGKPLTNLGVNDFDVFIDGARVKIDEVFKSETPVRLALLFDNSSSVTTARDFEVKAAVKFFRDVIRPKKDLASLFSVAGTTVLEQELTKSVKSLVRSIRNLPPPKGATALNDGIVKAANYLNEHAGRRVIVIVSDGQDTLSDIPFDKMVELVQKDNVQVYIVHTNDFENLIRTGSRTGSANLRALAAERRMKSLAEQTGGAVYSPIDEQELEQAFRQISAELSSQYILGYYPENKVRDGKFRKIDLKVKGSRAVTVRSRAGYFSK